MTLVDTSVWVDHLRLGSGALSGLLERGQVLCHPFVIGELALGHLRRRQEVLGFLGLLPRAPVATHDEVVGMIERDRLAGSGIGWIDAHLLASARLAGATLWTRDRRLAAVAEARGAVERS